ETILTEALQLLSGLTRSAGVVLTAKNNVRLKHVEFVRLEPERALAVLVAEDGQVENRVLNIPAGLPTSSLTEAGNFLNARIRGKTLTELRSEIEKAVTDGQAELDQLTQKIIETGLASWSGGDSEDRQLIVRGHANLLEDLRALEDLERVRSLFDALETKRGVIDLLGRAEQADGVRIFIGSENKLFLLSGSSTIVAPYRDSKGRIIGVIGVIGPTRLNYARVIPMVDYTARVVSRLLAPLRLIFCAEVLICRTSGYAEDGLSTMTDPTARQAETDTDDKTVPETADLVVEATRETAELKDKLLRTLAEMENLRKRTEREVLDARVY